MFLGFAFYDDAVSLRTPAGVGHCKTALRTDTSCARAQLATLIKRVTTRPVSWCLLCFSASCIFWTVSDQQVECGILCCPHALHLAYNLTDALSEAFSLTLSSGWIFPWPNGSHLAHPTKLEFFNLLESTL